MVGLKKNRKGMIAVFDAMVFIVLLSMAATWLFIFTSVSETEEPMAKTVSDDLFLVEVRTCDLMYLEDTKVLPIETLIAATMIDGRCQRTEQFISLTLEQLISEVYGYDLILEYKGKTLHFQRASDREMSSEYCEDHIIDGAGTLHSELRIY